MCENDGFVPVFEEKDLTEGAMEEILVQEIPILLIKKNGEIFVILNQCPHLGSPLAAGWDGNYIVGCCRNACAGMSFDIRTGKVAGVNYGSASPSEYAEVPFNLKKFDYKTKEGRIWVKL